MMNISMPQFNVAITEIFLLCMACLTVLIDVFLAERHRIVTYILVQLSLIGAFILTFPQFKDYPIPIVTFSGNYVLDKLAVISKLFIYLFSFFAFAYARDYLQARKIKRSDYYLLGLLSVIGMSVMASAYSFLTV